MNLLNQSINDSPGLGRKAKIVTWYRDFDEQQLASPPVSHEEVSSFPVLHFFIIIPDGIYVKDAGFGI